MKLKSTLIIMLLLIITNQSAMADSWTGADKGKHITVTAAISTAVTGYARNQGCSKVESFFWGFGAALVVGAIKEEADKHNDSSDSSSKDFAADALGGAAGALISAQFAWKF